MGYRVQRWGVEIEGYGLSRELVKHVVEAVTDDVCVTRDDNRPSSPLFWSVVHDGSIRQPGEFEVRSPALIGEDESWDKLRAVCRGLREAGAKVGITCGLHVHHDASLILKAMVAKGLAKPENLLMNAAWCLYARMERVIDTVMPPSRRQDRNRYCQSLRANGEPLPSVPARLVGGVDASLRRFGRGDWIDHHAKLSVTALLLHSTLEYRQHSGTLNAGKIIPWIKFTGLIQHKIAECALREEDIPAEREIDTLAKLLDYLDASQRLAGYFTRRASFFREQHLADCACTDCTFIDHTAARELQRLAYSYGRSDRYHWRPIQNVREVARCYSTTGRRLFEAAATRASWPDDQMEARRSLFARLLGESLGVEVVLGPSTSVSPQDFALPFDPDHDSPAEDGLSAEDGDYRDGAIAPYVQRTKAKDVRFRPQVTEGDVGTAETPITEDDLWRFTTSLEHTEPLDTQPIRFQVRR